MSSGDYDLTSKERFDLSTPEGRRSYKKSWDLRNKKRISSYHKNYRKIHRRKIENRRKKYYSVNSEKWIQYQENNRRSREGKLLEYSRKKDLS